MICLDFLSFLKNQNLFIVEIYKSIVAIGKHAIFSWIPIHIDIHGNAVIDQEAKDTLDDPI